MPRPKIPPEHRVAVSVATAAALMSVDDAQIQAWIQLGALTPVPTRGESVRIKVSQLEALDERLREIDRHRAEARRVGFRAEAVPQRRHGA